MEIATLETTTLKLLAIKRRRDAYLLVHQFKCVMSLCECNIFMVYNSMKHTELINLIGDARWKPNRCQHWLMSHGLEG